VTNWGKRQGPDDRVYIVTEDGDVEVPDLLTYAFGSNDPEDWPAWFQVGNRWVRMGENGEAIWTDTNPWETA